MQPISYFRVGGLLAKIHSKSCRSTHPNSVDSQTPRYAGRGSGRVAFSPEVVGRFCNRGKPFSTGHAIAVHRHWRFRESDWNAFVLLGTQAHLSLFPSFVGLNNDPRSGRVKISRPRLFLCRQCYVINTTSPFWVECDRTFIGIAIHKLSASEGSRKSFTHLRPTGVANFRAANGVSCPHA